MTTEMLHNINKISNYQITGVKNSSLGNSTGLIFCSLSVIWF